MERFTAELEEKFKVKSMVEKFDVEKTRRTPASSGVPTLSPRGWATNSRGGERHVQVPVPEGFGGLHVDWTTTMTRPDIAYAVRAVARFWNPRLAQY